jgi:hypothetical protein
LATELTTKNQIEIFEKICKLYKIKLKTVNSGKEIDKICNIPRDFDDVLHYKNKIYVVVSKSDLNDPDPIPNIKKTCLYLSIWHEIGHLIVSNKERNLGLHWLTPHEYELRETDCDKYIELCSRMENWACMASYYLMDRFGFSEEVINSVIDITSGLREHDFTFKNGKFQFCEHLDDKEIIEEFCKNFEKMYKEKYEN